MGSDCDNDVWIVLAVVTEKRSRKAMGCDTEMQPSYKFRGAMMYLILNGRYLNMTLIEN
jgi:hypothetical protein